MSNVLEFFIKMKDMMSSGLSKLSANAQSSFSKIQGGIDKTVAKNKELADSFKKVDTGAARGGMGIGGFIGKLGLVAGAVGIALGAFALGNSSIKKAMEYGATVKSFEVLTGSAAGGQALAGQLSRVSQDTILGDGIFKNAQTMMGFGIGQGDVIANIKMLGDVSMGSQDKLDSLTLAFSQVKAAGKLTGQDLLQFINAGFNPLNEISKMTGISLGKLKKKMEEGAISSDMIAEAFNHATGEGGLYHDMLNKMAETPAGKLAKLQGQWEAFQVKLGTVLMPLAEMAMDFAEPLIELAEKTLPVISSLLNALVFPIKDSVEKTAEWAQKSELVRDITQSTSEHLSLIDTIMAGINGTWNLFLDMVVNPLKDGAKEVLNLLDGAYRIWKIINFFPVEDRSPLAVNQQPLSNYIPGVLNLNSTVPKTTAAQIGNNSVFKKLTEDDKKKKKGEGSAASGITGGGPRVVNISGVKFMDKLADKLEINNQGDMDMVQQKFEEMFLRILNSGASVQ